MIAEVVSEHRYIKLKDAAMEIAMSPDFIRKTLIPSGKVVGVKMGERWVVELASWRRYLESRKRSTAA